MARNKLRRNRRKGREAEARRRIIRCMVLGGKATGVICATAALSLLFIFSHDFLVQCNYFNAAVVSVTGCRRLSETAVMNQAGVAPGVNILSVNLTLARKRLLAHPWIDYAEVRRDIPDAIHIRVREHVPLAVLDLGREFLINQGGAIFKSAAPGESAGLPLITGLTFADIGEAGESPAKPFQAVLDVLALGARDGVVLPNQLVREIHVDREIGLTLVAFEQERAIKLGYGSYPQKYARLRNVLFYMKQRRELVDFISIDLNDLERVVVSPAGKQVI
ncbi:MAG: FtsQ-type POTRA domain-containing protein [Desulfobacterales bacterium]|nr:FtsQ-type POTRA domain-containing protein [Desulfobacterales bacterium]